ncbi:MAG: hypothetical protein ACPG32_14220, partial [Akkermansiaceae bacterium]
LLLIVLNALIALVLVGAVFLLQQSANRYKPQTTMDQNYIEMTAAETDAKTLRHGILHTEAARASAYSSVVKLSHGTSLTWILVAFAFLMNAIFMMRMQRKSNELLAEASAA